MPRQSVRTKAVEEASPDTRNRILIAAEAIMASKGIGGASLREIALKAGCANNYAVQYHFGTKEGLVKALSDHRAEQVELKRSVMMEGLAKGNRIKDARALIEILCMPTLDFADEDGKNTYAQFMSEYITKFQKTRYSHSFSGEGPRSPALEKLIKCLGDCIPHVPDQLKLPRITNCYLMFVNVIIELDNFPPADRAALWDLYIEDVLSMTTCALLAP